MQRVKPAASDSAQILSAPDIGGTKSTKKKNKGNGDLGFEATLWSAADRLRGSMDASEYKHPVLGLI